MKAALPMLALLLASATATQVTPPSGTAPPCSRPQTECTGSVADGTRKCSLRCKTPAPLTSVAGCGDVAEIYLTWYLDELNQFKMIFGMWQSIIAGRRCKRGLTGVIEELGVADPQRVEVQQTFTTVGRKGLRVAYDKGDDNIIAPVISGLQIGSTYRFTIQTPNNRPSSRLTVDVRLKPEDFLLN